MIDPTIYGFQVHHSDKVPGLLMWRRGNIVIYPLPDLTGLPGEKSDETASWVIDTHNKSQKDKPYLLTSSELLEYLRDIKVDQIVKK